MEDRLILNTKIYTTIYNQEESFDRETTHVQNSLEKTLLALFLFAKRREWKFSIERMKDRRS